MHKPIWRFCFLRALAAFVKVPAVSHISSINTTILIRYLTDDIHYFRNAGFFSSFVYNRQITVYSFCYSSCLTTPPTSGETIAVFWFSEDFLYIIDKNRSCKKIICWNIEKTLYLTGMKINH